MRGTQTSIKILDTLINIIYLNIYNALAFALLYQ